MLNEPWALTAASVLITGAAVLLGRLLFRRSGRRELNAEELLERTGLDELVGELPKPTYCIAEIPKRGGGTRRLEIPDDATKAVQRRILHRLLASIKRHPAAVGFTTGKSIVDAARPHCDKAVVVKVDIEQFFETTTTVRIRAWLRSLGWNERATELLLVFLTWNGHLPQGAPTSPAVSNLVNAPMDTALQRLAQRQGGHYTRYADDLTFSFSFDEGRRIRGVLRGIEKRLAAYGYRLNKKKTRILRRHQQQRVLGLVVNKKVQLPRKLRRQLRAAQFNSNGHPDDSLQGWMAFQEMIESSR